MSGNLTHSGEDITRRLLIGGSLGTDPSDQDSWPIFAVSEPTKPDNCITVYATTNTLDGRVMNNGEIQEHLGIQIRIRSTDYVTGRAKAKAIADYLDETVLRTAVTIDSSEYEVQCFNRRSAILHIGTELPTSKREVFTINYIADMRQTT